MDIALRTGHLLGVCGVAAGVLHAPLSAAAVATTLLTGVGLVASELWRHGSDWLRYGQAWLLLAKLAALGAGAALGSPLAGAVAAVVLGSVASHAPGSLRHAALWGPPGPCARCAPTDEAADP